VIGSIELVDGRKLIQNAFLSLLISFLCRL
jgi:hypothetical protein